MISIKLPPKKTNKEIEKFFKKRGLNLLINESKGKQLSVNEMIEDNPRIPELNDLYRLYQFIVLNKRTTILEFGSGWSSLIFYLSLNDLKKKYSKQVKNLRRNNPFELIILESIKKYLNISKNRIIKFSKMLKLKQTPKTHYCFSDVEMTLFNNKIATQYKKLPLCNPDFIYLDGPYQFNVVFIISRYIIVLDELTFWGIYFFKICKFHNKFLFQSIFKFNSNSLIFSLATESLYFPNTKNRMFNIVAHTKIIKNHNSPTNSSFCMFARFPSNYLSS